MRTHPLFGLIFATFGVLILTPDTMFMRWSEMDGAGMMAWRGLLMGAAFLAVWVALSRGRTRDLTLVLGGAGALAVLSHAVNAILFAAAIAVAPVAVVLFGVATVPIWAALFSRIIMGEPTRRATWITMGLVLTGIGLAVFGEAGGVSVDRSSLTGALMGLGVAASLALTFVLFRKHHHLPVMLCIGCGAMISGLLGFALGGIDAMSQGVFWAIAITGLIILPVSFWALSEASRHTHASNVSLLLLLETVLGPVWVWAGTGEAPTTMMILGGAIVVVSLAGYILVSARQAV